MTFVCLKDFLPNDAKYFSFDRIKIPGLSNDKDTSHFCLLFLYPR